MNLSQIIKEEFQKYEGVGDKYAEKKWHIPDEEKDFERKYKSQLDSDSSMGDLIGIIKHYLKPKEEGTRLFVNPTSLNGFEADVRAVSDKSSNLFVSQIDGNFSHTEIGDTINDNPNFVLNDEIYYLKEYMLWHRIGKTNKFGLSDSYMDLWMYDEYKDDIEIQLEELRKQHPQYEFILEFWLDLKKNRNINEIVDEEINAFLNEDVDWDYYEMKDEKMMYLLDDFLNKNNHDFTNTVKWSVVKYPRLKKIWEDFMRYGFVRDVKGLNMIEQKMVNNTMKVEIFTELAGHTSYDPEEHFDDAFRGFIENQIECYRIETTHFDKDQLEIDFDNGGKGKRKIEPKCNQPLHPYIEKFIEENKYEELSNEELYKKIDKQLRERFYEYYMKDPKSGQAYISDYGLDPLLELVNEVRRQTKPEDKLVTLDKMLNVVHMRSDIAAWFVEGGSSALSDLSGYEHDDESGSGVMKKDIENA